MCVGNSKVIPEDVMVYALIDNVNVVKCCPECCIKTVAFTAFY